VNRTWRLTAGATVAGFALAAGAVAAAGPWDGGRRTAERERAAAAVSPAGADHRNPVPPRTPPGAPPPPGVLEALGTAAAPAAPAEQAYRRALAARLGPLAAAPGLGPSPTVSVVDLTTGRELYGKGATAPMPPASTVKIATAVAALSALGPGHRIPTRVLGATTGGRTTVTLVGGGDASLDTPRLRALADRTAAALRAERVTSVRLTWDAGLYRGPVVHRIGPNDNLAPVTALMVDQGRARPGWGASPRSTDPAGDAARAFAALLGARGVRTEGAPAAARPADGARRLAETLSAPLSTLVERTLTSSDNDLAEALARQTAAVSGREPSFTGAGAAVRDRLAALKLPLAGARFPDGSGLDREGRVSARLLTALLARAAETGRPALRPVLTGLPVAGFNGTLATRYAPGSPATGMIRAKTGTLTGVNSLAGTAVAPGGRLLAFALLAGKTPSRDEAQPALDRLAAALTS
jgi:serine-type D-Ala-D-Ala carboxypeptidase/endopeptidase (penicillin-binding protein 4)